MTIRPTTTSASWLLGGAGWLAASVVGATASEGSTRFYAAEAIWIPTQAILLIGTVGLLAARPHGRRWLGHAGFATAIAGRLLFLAAEVVSIATGATAETILPVAAVLTAAGMIAAGAATVREHRWSGWRRFSPLAMGVYPVVFMFPLAATDVPVEMPVAVWALPIIAVGVAVRSDSAHSSNARPPGSPNTSVRR